MIELEVLVENYDGAQKAINKLCKLSQVQNSVEIVDYYFYNKSSHLFAPNNQFKTFEVLRLRNSNNEKITLTYKKDHYENNIWQFSDEQEVGISNFNDMKALLCNLGFDVLLKIHNNRTYFTYKDYEIVVENVDDLGSFLEIEYKGYLTESDVAKKRKELLIFIKSLGLNTSDELNSGKPELYMLKHKEQFLQFIK